MVRFLETTNRDGYSAYQKIFWASKRIFRRLLEAPLDLRMDDRFDDWVHMLFVDRVYRIIIIYFRAMSGAWEQKTSIDRNVVVDEKNLFSYK